MIIDVQALFERQRSFPTPDARDAFNRLIGLDVHKDKLRKLLALLVYPTDLTAWRERFHSGAGLVLDTVLRRPPLVILAGDVGSGKTSRAIRRST